MSEKSIFDAKDTYQPTIKKAKRKSLKRTILTSLIVTLTTLITISVVFAGAYLYMYKTMNHYAELQGDEAIIRGANIAFDRSTTSFGIESAVTQDQYRKNIDGIPYTWYNEQTHYKIYDKPTTLLDTTITSFDGKQYYRNGQQVMNFLYPKMKESTDDLSLLTSLNKNTKVEIAISFKNELTVDEMLAIFPTAQWAWVIDPTNRDLSERALQDIGPDFTNFVISEYAYGFSIPSDHDLQVNIDEFKQALQSLSSKESDMKQFSEEVQDHLQVGGVVVTGMVEELLPLLEQEQVNYVSVGVIMPQ